MEVLKRIAGALQWAASRLTAEPRPKTLVHLDETRLVTPDIEKLACKCGPLKFKPVWHYIVPNFGYLIVETWSADCPFCGQSFIVRRYAWPTSEKNKDWKLLEYQRFDGSKCIRRVKVDFEVPPVVVVD